ncbi:FHA domain-containing protein [Lacipirellula limnantheis]|uniref:Chromosome partition protein Smc n=1 Tax=Lacipirellula limnantheis TaxID=2528024 RepID=A0A517U344_9BACT|nr:FHA domain-containing protein [Lacipirellula limnantheis]QDT75040.1 Chromosome partition protein Smc [Lacipirellula limnantheis]
MSLLTLPETATASTTLLRKPDSLRLRLADELIRVEPLVEGKTTVGSSPQCTIVLPGADCRPLQCVVAVDSHRVEATRWGAGVQLNRRDFTKAPVAVGDKLTIGRYELEFAASAQVDDVSTTGAGAGTAPPPPAAASASLALLPSETPTVDVPETDSPVVSAALSRLTDLNMTATSVETREPLSPSLAPTPDAMPTALADNPALLHAPPAPEAAQPAAVVEPPQVACASELAPLPPTAAVTGPSATGNNLAFSSHAFADELILELWQVGDRSRRRAKSLIAATRDARFRTNAMAADLAAMEIELDLARAAYDSHAADHEQLHLELIERDRRASERIGPLLGEVESLRSQLAAAQTDQAAQAARCAELNAALHAQQASAEESAAARTAAAAHAADLEQSLRAQIEQATLLARELGAVRTELDGVRLELEQHATRRRELDAELAAVQAERDSFKQQAAEAAFDAATIAQLRGDVESLENERANFAGKLSDAEAELHRLAGVCHTANERVAELEQAIAAQESISHTTPASETCDTPATPSEHGAAGADESPDAAAIDEAACHTVPEEPAASGQAAAADHEALLHAWNPADEPQQEASATVDSPIAEEPATEEPSADTPVAETPSADAPVAQTPVAQTPVAQTPVAQTPVAEAPPATTPRQVDEERSKTSATPVETAPVASDVAPTSFIDKYRHLLEDNDGDSLTPAAPPEIDDEFLSPAKAADRTVPADDSDEALDAYMASMMQRMRSSSSSTLPEPASNTPTAPAAVDASESAPLDYDPSIPFEIESMKQGRRATASTDLTALREIANTSARSAIATHRKKRKVESAIGKMVVAFTALGTSGYLIWNAPSLQDWQSSAGIAIGIIGCGAAVLAMRHPDRASAVERAAPQPASSPADESIHRDA